jgi:hypothetical protein
MRTPRFITFTGADQRTNLSRMDDIARRWSVEGTSLVEWGLLFSRSNRDARYITRTLAEEMLGVAGAKAAHICGALAREVEETGAVGDEIPLERFDRAQINGMKAPAPTLTKLAKRYGVTVILQTKAAEFPRDPLCQFLYDASGGNGIFPEHIPPLPQDRLVGYAGGMGPETVLPYLQRIQGDGDFWIDMEGRLRSEGYFDLDAVERVLEQVFD